MKFLKCMGTAACIAGLLGAAPAMAQKVDKLTILVVAGLIPEFGS